MHQRFIGLLDSASIDLDQDFSLLKVINMKTSASNHWVGQVSAVRAGAVNDEVELTLPGGARIVAIVTRDASERLALRPHMTAMALIPASAVMIATDLHGTQLSARNQLPGTVGAITPGAVNAEVHIDLAGGGHLVATITQASVQTLGLVVGAAVTAFFKASSVIIAVTV